MCLAPVRRGTGPGGAAAPSEAWPCCCWPLGEQHPTRVQSQPAVTTTRRQSFIRALPLPATPRGPAPPHPIGGRSLPGHAERPAEARPHPPVASWASTSVLRARGRSRGGIRAALSGSAAAPVSGAAGVTCPALGAAGSSGDRGLSSRRRPRLLSRCRHARLLHHFFQRRARSLVLSGRERLMHRAC